MIDFIICLLDVVVRSRAIIEHYGLGFETVSLLGSFAGLVILTWAASPNTWSLPKEDLGYLD